MKLSQQFSKKQWVLIAVIFLLLAGCVPLPIDPHWASLTTIGDAQQILFAFHDRVALVDPIDGSAVELRDGSGQVRVDAQSGSPLVWSLQIPAQPATQFYYAPILVDDATILLPSFNRRFYEVDLQAARLLTPEGRLIEADTTTSHIVADVLATDDMLYVPLSEGDVKAIDRSSFTERWTFNTEHGIWSEPLLVDNTLYVTALDHNLYAIDPETGDEIWRVSLEGAAPARPVFHEGYLYVGSFARKLFKIDLDGRIAAQATVNDWIWGTVAVEGDNLYVGDASGYVYAFDISGADLNEMWQRKVADRTIRATPLIHEDQLIVASRDHRAYWLSRADGGEIFRRELIGEVLADMLVIEPNDATNITEAYVIISTMARDESLVAFTLENGERRWAYRH